MDRLRHTCTFFVMVTAMIELRERTILFIFRISRETRARLVKRFGTQVQAI